MKEFVEKLIERLEEEKSDWNYDYNVPINKAIQIVKELAEEHNNDFCVWEDTESLREKGVCYGSDGLYKPGCNDDEDDFRDWNWIRHFNFCPYCGKKIKIVQEQQDTWKQQTMSRFERVE